MNAVPVCVRIAGREYVPVHENEPLVGRELDLDRVRVAVVQFHWRSGASTPRGNTVLSYG